MPADFRFHDLQHFFASLLIASGGDVRVVQARLRHASAKTTLATYGHLWPYSDDSTRAAIEAVMAARADAGVDSLRTEGGATTPHRRSAGVRALDVVVVTDLPALTCANAVPAGPGYARRRAPLQVSGFQVPVLELFSRAG